MVVFLSASYNNTQVNSSVESLLSLTTRKHGFLLKEELDSKDCKLFNYVGIVRDINQIEPMLEELKSLPLQHLKWKSKEQEQIIA